MAKEVMVVTPEDIKSHIALSAAASDTLKWMIAHAGVEMDEEAQAEFIQQRALRVNEIRECWELKAWCEKAAASIKEYTEHLYNLGTPEELPDGEDGVKVSWSKQSYTYEWDAYGSSVQVVKDLESKGICTTDTALCELSVDAVIRASGLTKEKLIDMYPEQIVAKPKKRTLSIK